MSTIQNHYPVEALALSRSGGTDEATATLARRGNHPVEEVHRALELEEAQFLSAQVHAALAAGDEHRARELAELAHAARPECEELAHLCVLLSPPESLGLHDASKPSLAAKNAWLQAHGEQYRGQWVAIRESGIVAAADHLEALLAQVTDRGATLFTRVH